MSRHNNQSYSHRIVRLAPDFYRLVWTVDRYSAHSRLRFPTEFKRETDLGGAQKFAEKWGLDIPVEG